MKVGKAVKKETLYILAWTLMLSALMQSVVLIIGKWDLTMLFGNLWGGFFAVFNFFLMGITVQKAVLREEKAAKDLMKLSQTLRNFMLVIVAVIGACVPVFNVYTVLVALFFPRIAITFRTFFDKKAN